MSDAIFIDSQTPEVKRGRGRPRKERTAADNEPQLLFRAEAAAAFRKAKLEHEKDLPYELNNAQFMMLLITAFSENQ
mgnify:FL=1|tara:strand:+ start:1484 stop:1714 length:231 start_codon:yes stop_codon:yes gene_type:complete